MSNHEKRDAVFSDCTLYRYELTRIWDNSKPIVNFIGLNPSTADEIQDDPTMERCRGYAQRWGYGGFAMTNLFAYRATDPNDLFNFDGDKIGSQNDKFIKKWHNKAEKTIVAWGGDGVHNNRCHDVLQILGDVYCLTKLKHGQPGHPLYKSADLEPIPYTL